MSELKNKPEPKKIKMPSVVDRSQWYDTMSWVGNDSARDIKPNEDNQQNNSQSIQQLESESTD